MSTVTDAYEGEQLPHELPGSPFEIFSAWFEQARAARDQPNPNAMTLATVDQRGHPHARVVLCKGFDADLGKLVFYTNRQSGKGRDLQAAPRAALAFHWDHADRQVRVEGPVTISPEDESDAYFKTRRWESRLGAWASDQSRPIDSRDDLLAKVAAKAMELDLDLSAIVDDSGSNRAEDLVIPRPPHWGGYRVWAESVELWCGGTGRVHDRARWARELAPETVDGAPGYVGAPWTATRLQP